MSGNGGENEGAVTTAKENIDTTNIGTTTTTNMNEENAKATSATTVMELCTEMDVAPTVEIAAAAAPPTPAAPIYQLLITLQRIKPKLWRKVEVSSDMTLSSIHTMIQCCMGWSDTHLYKFTCLSNKKCYTTTAKNLFDPTVCTLSNVLINEKDTIKYIYDFGVNWGFELELLKILPPPSLPSSTEPLAATKDDGQQVPSPTSIIPTTTTASTKKTNSKKKNPPVLLYPRVVSGKNTYTEYPTSRPHPPFDLQQCQMKFNRMFHHSK